MKLSVVFEYLDKASTPIAKTISKFSALNKAIDRTQACLWRFNQTAELMGRVGDTMGKLMQPGVEFEQSMADLSSITGIAGADLEKLGEVARETGKASGLGASGAANAFALLASQIDVSKIGMDGLMELQRKTITLAQASGMSMQEAADSMAGTINQFGLQAGQAGRVINILAAGSKYGAAEIPELAQSFKVVGAAANAAGLSVESTAGAIEVLSKNNLKGAEAGTTLRNIVLKMQTAMGVDFSKTSLQEALVKLKPHMKDAAYMSKLFGMENVAAAQFLVANSDMVKEMTDRVTDTNVATEQAAIRTDTWSHFLKVQAATFNDWAIRIQKNCGGILYGFQLIGQGSNVVMTIASMGKVFMGLASGTWSAGLGIAKFVRTLKMLSVAKASGSAYSYARAVVQCGRMGRIASGMLTAYNTVMSKASWLALKSAVTTKLSAAALWLKNGALAAGTGILSAWNTLANAATWTQLRQMAATKLQAMWTFVSSKAMLIAGAVTTGWSKVTAVATWIQGGLTKALSVGRAVMTGGMIPALAGVIASTWAWTAALLANPVTWVVLAVGALIAAVVACWQKFAGFRAVVLTIWDTVKGFGGALYNYLVTPLKVVWKLFSGLGTAIYKLFTGDFKGAGEAFTDAFKEGFDEAAEGFKKTVNGVKDTVGGMPGNYEMHLTDERAKQAEKERAKEKKKEAPEVMANVPGVKMPQIRAEKTVVMMNREAAGGKEKVIAPKLLQVVPLSPADAGGVQQPEVQGGASDTEVMVDFVLPPIPEVQLQGASPMIMPEVQTVNPQKYAQLPELESQVNRFPEVSQANERSGAGQPDAQVSKIEVNFQPVVNISAEMTQKAKDDLLSVFRRFSEELTQIVEEQQRRNGRVNYAVS